MKNRKSVFIAVICILLAFASSLLLAGCNSEGDNSSAGTVWHSGEDTPASALGADGDYYFETDTADVWKKADGSWSVIANIKGSDGKDGNNGKDGTDGNDGNDGNDAVITPKEDKLYAGYGGYIWSGKTKTDILAKEPADNVYEDTLGIIGDMQEYFDGEYLSLSTAKVALMANYQPNANKTFYSGLDISKITVYSKANGTLYIGTAKVSEIEAKLTSGGDVSVSSAPYSVTAGLSTVEFNPPLRVGSDETVVLGGQSSVSLYMAKSIPVYDEIGNYAYLNGRAGTTVSMSGDIENTLAIKVECREGSIHKQSQALPSIVEDSNGNIVYGREATLSSTPFIYYEASTRAAFSSKRLSVIGIPVVSVEAIDSNQTFTFHIAAVGSTEITINKSYTVKLPAEQLGSDHAAVNRWVYVDLSSYNIMLTSTETLAFGSSTDTVIWGYGAPTATTNTYRFATVSNINSSSSYPNLSTALSTTGIFFDVWYEESSTAEERVANLEAVDSLYSEMHKRDTLISALKAAGKNNISILGDSISTYTGVTSGTSAAQSTNSTISSNAVWYTGSKGDVTDVRRTWWHQAAFTADLDVLVNNAWSGDQLAGSGKGLSRCEQLHDDTGTNAGTKPDIIAVFFGTNDVGRNVAPDTFKTLYTQMVDKMKAKYSDADIFLFTLLDTVDPDVTEEELASYNKIIKEIAAEKGCTVVDLQYDSGITKYNFLENTIDGVHPNAAGMDKITNCFLNAMYDKYVG